MALNSNNKKDIFNLNSLLPPTVENIDKNKLSEDPVIPNKDIKIEKPVTKPKKTTAKSEAPKKQSLRDTGYFNARIKFLDEDDKAFLKFYGGNLNKTQEEFLIYLVECEINNEKPIDFKDELHESFRSTPMIYSTSSKIPLVLKPKITKVTAKHRLTQEQLLGNLVRSKRLKTPGWN